MSALPRQSKRCDETRAHYAHQWVITPSGSVTGTLLDCPGGPEECVPDVLAKFEALADRWADDTGIEGYINLGEAEDAIRAVIAEARS